MIRFPEPKATFLNSPNTLIPNLYSWSNTQPNKWLFLIYFLFFQISTIVSVLLSLVPFTFLIILNILIFRTIKQKTPALSRSSRRQQRDIFVASILILIIMVYAACHSIKVFINILELFCVLTGKNLWCFSSCDLFILHQTGISRAHGVLIWTSWCRCHIFWSPLTVLATLLYTALRWDH